MLVPYPTEWQEALSASEDPVNEARVVYGHAFFYMNTPTGVLIKDINTAESTLVFIPDQHIACYEPVGDEDPPYKQWGFCQIYTTPGMIEFNLDDHKTHVTDSITVNPGDWASGAEYEPMKPEGDF